MNTTQQRHPCEGCKRYVINDYGYGPYERHDYFCFKWWKWRPYGCDEKEELDHE